MSVVSAGSLHNSSDVISPIETLVPSAYFLCASGIHTVYFDNIHPHLLPGTPPPSLQPNFVFISIFLLNSLSPICGVHVLKDM